jgi:HAD superfamily hydrolase (TIGR01509 family)
VPGKIFRMTSQTPAAVLWDMDGTLIDSEPLWVNAEHALLSRFGAHLTAEQERSLIGTGLWDCAELMRSCGVDLSADDIVAELCATVSAQMDGGELRWRPGARELLANLSKAGVPCALVTMSIHSLAQQVVDLLPAGSFQLLVGGDEVALEKPHPEAYLTAAARLGVPIEACLAFEDSVTGLRSASRSGAVTIGIPNLIDLTDAPSHAIIDTLDLLDAGGVSALFDRLRPTPIATENERAAPSA